MKGKVKDVSLLKQLFVDDYLIEEMRNVSKTFHQAKKHPANPMLTPDRPWEGDMIHIYGTVLYDEQQKLFRMWYCGGPTGTLYAVSKDGVSWEKPNLGLVEFEGSKENNIISIEGSDPASGIIYTPELVGVEYADRVYKTLRLVKGGLGVFFSTDGLSWKPYEKNPVITDVGDVCPVSDIKSSNLPGDNSIPKRFYFKDKAEIPLKYLAFPKLGAKVGKFVRRSVGYSGSSAVFPNGFLNWSRPTLVLAPDERDDEILEERVAASKQVIEFDCPADHRTEFYGMCGFRYGSLYLGLLWVFYVTMETDRVGHPSQHDGPVEVQLTSSRDLIHWERVGNREPIVPLGKMGEWDCGELYTANSPIIVGDEIWIYYSGFSVTHESAVFWSKKTRDEQLVKIKAGEKPKFTGIGLATLRLDGFVSVDAGQKEGTLTTKSLVFDGDKLVINAEAKQGSVAVELLNEQGRSIAGFKHGDCDAFSGDSVRHVVTWRGSSDVSQLRGKTVKMRFHLKQAKLYSFVFQDT